MPKTDLAIRLAGFEIHARPRTGEPLWAYRGRMTPLRESEVLKIVNNPRAMEKYRRVAESRLKAVLA